MRWVILLIPGSLGLLLVWGGVVGVLNTWALQRRGLPAAGIVVGTARSGSRSITYNAVVEFNAADGNRHRFEMATGKYDSSEVEMGKTVEVVYDAANPSRAVAGSVGSISGSVVMAIIGLAILGALVTMTSSRERAMNVAGSLRWVAVAIVALVGLALFLSGASWSAKRYLLRQGGMRAEGAVLDYLPAARGSGEMVVVGYSAADGQRHQFAVSTFRRYKDGVRLEVIYRPDDPSTAVVNDFQQFWLGPLAVTLLGLFFLGLAALAWVFVKDAVVAVAGAESA